MERFQTINEWLYEQVKKETNNTTYGCVMLDANKMSNWDEYHIGGIDPKDVYVKPNDDSYGLEDNPHITILYGIHEDEIDPEVIEGVIQNEFKPVTVIIKEISIFEKEEYDVVKYDVPLTNQILRYRNKIEKRFANTQSFPDYHPHITLAYVKHGEGKKYVKKLEEPFEITFGKGVYSFHDKDGELVRREYVFPIEEVSSFSRDNK